MNDKRHWKSNPCQRKEYCRGRCGWILHENQIRRVTKVRCWGAGVVTGPARVNSCFTLMYLECARGVACPPSLWQYRLPGFCVRWFIPRVPPWVTDSRFLMGNREDEPTPNTFSSLLRFRVFLPFLFSWPPSDIVLLSGLLVLIYIYIWKQCFPYSLT